MKHRYASDYAAASKVIRFIAIAIVAIITAFLFWFHFRPADYFQTNNRHNKNKHRKQSFIILSNCQDTPSHQA